MRDDAPQPASPAAPAAQPPPTWVKVLLGLTVFAGLPAAAGAAWFMGVLMMAFASDAGVRDQARADLALLLFNAGLGVVGSTGMPAALAVFVEPLRKPMAGLAILGALGGGVCAVCGLVTFATSL